MLTLRSPYVLIASGLMMAGALRASSYQCKGFSMPGGPARVTGINNAGVLVRYYTAGTSHGFIENPATGTFITIDYPGATSTTLFTINNNDVATGKYQSGNTTGWFT